ncbi:competence protein CoiA [Bacillus sp. FJAT-27445]|uniref:competence protein CoiA n=1 Tax=Bacillus sp. FJAT-27445 TaxID=1679166 RepID=UPI0007440548|nr:competence protein CoiA family protein [Bacillus sp. FJAT-27445]
MLTAKTKDGGGICLADGYSRKTLENWRGHEEFYCPVCGGKLLLKLGEQRIYHFSHLRSACEESNFERESEYHLSGKLALFHWLKRQGIPAILEYYDPVISQRPDIAFPFQGQRIALEYQCSPIPDRLFIKRTTAYLSAGYIPFWILGGSHLSLSKNNSAKLSGFHYLFLRSSQGIPGYIPYFCPESGRVTLLQSIIPYSNSKAFARMEQADLETVSFTNLFSPQPPPTPVLPNWQDKLVQSKLAIGANPKTKYLRFLKELYKAGLNIFLLPPVIGLPGLTSQVISTFPVIWQAYLILDAILGKKPGSVITANEAAASLALRVQEGDVKVRQLPLAAGLSLHSAVSEYLLLLERCGILTSINFGTFMVKKELYFPKTVAEQTTGAEAFFKTFPKSDKSLV